MTAEAVWRVLGPIGIAGADAGPPKQRCVLAVLLLSPGRGVPVATMVDRVWGADPPRVGQPLAPHVSRLRRLMTAAAPGAELRHEAGGYRLDCDPDTVDLHRARRVTAEARTASAGGDDATARDLLATALSAWQPVALAGLSGDWAQRTRESLARERVDVVAQRAGAGLRLARYTEVADELWPLVDEQPALEVLVAPLLEALAAAGRPADALRLFGRTRAALADELGAEPSPALRALHARILRLRDDGARPPSATATATAGRAPAGSPRPETLPAGGGVFTGRGTELAAVDAVLAAGALCLVTGSAGVGKTTLAVRWGHDNRDRFPDGSLYVNLRGHDPDSPADPAAVLTELLVSLGEDGSTLPAGLGALAARFRTRTAGRRLLLLLDNALSAEQVRPLLPGAAGCAVLVTSRESLRGLVAVNGARRVPLDVLSPDDAIALLRVLIGTRVDDEPDAAALLARRCDHLPLALRVAAELATSAPARTLASLAAELADGQDRLDRLDGGGDPRAAVTEVFSWSLRHLPDDTAATFVALGVHPGPDAGLPAVAALAARPPAEVEGDLGRLCAAHLVTAAGGRYLLHDLLRAYGRSLAEASGLADKMLHRLLDHNLAVAGLAMDLAYPAEAHQRPATLTDPWAPALRTAADARSWLDTERAGLVAAVARAASGGRPDHAVRLSATLYRYLDAGHSAEAAVVHGHAHAAARLADDLAGEGRALLGLAASSRQHGRHHEALAYLEQALPLVRRAGAASDEARALTSLGIVQGRLGRYREAAVNNLAARDRFRSCGDTVGEVKALTNLGVTHVALDELGTAREVFREAVDLATGAGDDGGRAYAMHSLAEVESALGCYAEARNHFDTVLEVARRHRDATAEAWILDGLGTLAVRTGRPGDAAELFRESRAIFEANEDLDGLAWTENGLGEAACRAGRPDEATDRHREALGLALGTGNRSQEARAYVGLARAARAAGDARGCAGNLAAARRVYADLDVPAAGKDDETLLALAPAADPG